jgi:uncharacterized membrane protein
MAPLIAQLIAWAGFWMAGRMGLLPAAATLPGALRFALALAALLVLMFPANAYAARAKLPIAGRPAMPLVARLLLQLFWIGGLLWVAAEN